MNSNFNPHHREGGDLFAVIVSDAILISIHTTAKVVTLSISKDLFILYISIHTTAKVVTVYGC